MNSVVSKSRIVIAIATVLVISATISSSSFAKTTLTDSDEAMFSQNDILFYEPCETSGGGSQSEICGNNQNYAGEQVFSDEQMKAIEANQPFYEKAAEKYGFPWQLIAVIHKREHGLVRSNPGNGQGVYQFYSAERRAACKGGNFSPGKISDEQFQIQTNCAAQAIKESYGSGLDLNSDDGIKEMFFRYNGKAQAYINQALKLGFSQKEAEIGEGSPYVMNRFDAKREPSSTWGQIKTDGGSIQYPANEDFGAFVYYKAITCDGTTVNPNDSAGSGDSDVEDSSGPTRTSATNSGSTGNADKIAKTALALAWGKNAKESDYNKNKGGKPSDAVQEAWEVLGTTKGNIKHGPDCGYFVQAVLGYSGVDPNYSNKSLSLKIESYAKKNPDKWEVIEWNDGDASKLKSGDIILGHGSNSGTGFHTWIAADIDGELWKVEASYTRKLWGRVSKKVGKKWKSYNKQLIVRIKGGSAPSCNSCAQGSKNINGAGVCLAWPLGSTSKDYDQDEGGHPVPLMQQAWRETGLYDRWKDDSDRWESDFCSGWVAAVVRWSGYDPNFSEGQPGALSYVKRHPDLWEVIPWSKKKEDLQGGDVLYSDGNHTWMVVEDEAGELYIAEASLHGNTFGHIREYGNGNTGYSSPYIFRAKSANNSAVGVSVTDGVQASSNSGAINNAASKGSGDIGASAIELAWPEGTSESTIQKKASEKFTKYFDTLSQSKSDAGKCYGGGKSCDRFVATSVRYSGVDKEFNFGPVDTGTLPYLEGSSNWEEVKMSNTKSTSEYKSGDVLIFYKKGASSPSHVGIYATDSSGKGHVVQASYCEYFGVVKDTSSITGSYWGSIRVFRNKNNNSNGGTTECDVCPNKDESSDDSTGSGELKDGGFTSEKEAEDAIIKEYSKYKGNPVSDFGVYKCNTSRDNCVTFSLWFIKHYLGWESRSLHGDGWQIADNLYNKYHSKYPELTKSSTPSVYSIASWHQRMPNTNSGNHTGVVVGIDQSKNTILIAEAGWCVNNGHVETYKLSDFNGKGTYVNVTKYIKGL